MNCRNQITEKMSYYNKASLYLLHDLLNIDTAVLSIMYASNLK
jgi:hypothetical protein